MLRRGESTGSWENCAKFWDQWYWAVSDVTVILTPPTFLTLRIRVSGEK